jgi:hypothetical protein
MAVLMVERRELCGWEAPQLASGIEQHLWLKHSLLAAGRIPRRRIWAEADSSTAQQC